MAQARPTSEGTSFDFDSWLSGLADKARPRCVSIRALFAGMTPYGLEANKVKRARCSLRTARTSQRCAPASCRVVFLHVPASLVPKRPDRVGQHSA